MSIRTRVACIAIRDHKIVLMEKLLPHYFNYRQLTPPGGGLEVHETLEAACIREMEEESGLRIRNPQLKGVVSYIYHGNDNHSVTFFFITREVEGELIAMEPEKHIPRWVELETLEQNEAVPRYYQAFIRILLEDGQPPLNARVEWNKPGAEETFSWCVV